MQLFNQTDYENCGTCNKPSFTEGNLHILRRNWIKWGVIGTVSGAVIGYFMLPIMGFGGDGITAASFAANYWQGPAVAAGSVFSILQSLGATGLGVVMFGAVGAAAGGVGALGLIYKYREKFDWCSCD